MNCVYHIVYRAHADEIEVQRPPNNQLSSRINGSDCFGVGAAKSLCLHMLDLYMMRNVQLM
jgi:hypothetical protein